MTTADPKSPDRQVNPIVQAAADQVAEGKRRPRKNLHEPCRGQLSLFDSKEGTWS
ncbi:hypothetical protein [Nocardia lijiangensis]|uniref:hypothetical protein n=1 Tax=Nocardia lijiangensis TaxID=299618 RepID=UPI000B323FE2|nr:hypothetical protein [Nocardia lijiangensis]